jgi:hypothetical protein
MDTKLLSRLGPWRPDAYHGAGKRRNFFEGWYFKLVDAPGRYACAVIPGVFMGANPSDSHAFVQTLDGATGRSTFHRYPLGAFSASPREFDVRIGPNHFRTDGLRLELDFPERRMHGELRFTGVTPWPVTLTSPGIMGWYALVPFMECYHGVVSLDHGIEGAIVIDSEAIDFTGGRGYTEKDWGKSFPRAWIWMQTNHFDTASTCLTASVARIPWLGNAFRGFIVGLWHDGRLYRFATYTGAQILHLQVSDGQVLWQMAGRAGPRGDRALYRLALTANRAEGGLLHAPWRTDMQPRVVESLTATVDVNLWRSAGSREELVFAGQGRHAGLEINGELHEILDKRQVIR